MKALSIRQPWAWLIVNGWKDIENRTWNSHYRGPFYVHAAGSLYGTAEERERIRKWVLQHFGVHLPWVYERGGIVGSATLVDVVEKSTSPWFDGPRGLVLEDPRPLRFRPCAGRLGFFEVD